MKPGITIAVARERLLAGLILDEGSGCWLWAGAEGKDGYGRIGWKRSTSLVHRVSYEAFVGPIPHGLQLDHLCRVTACFNPDHLEPVTNRENVMRSSNRNVAVAVTHVCRAGIHDLTDPANQLMRKSVGRIQCRPCRNATRRAGKY